MKLAMYYRTYALVHYLPLFLISITLLCTNGAPIRTIVDANSITNISSQSTCPNPVDPTAQSLLIVLLDRSSSLVAGPDPTDPKLYSTSVTKALADLWPGTMAVIPFGSDHTTTLGPVILSDSSQRETLKKNIQNYPISFNTYTPLDSALHNALDLLHGQSNPPGSRVIIITDEKPTGNGNNDGLQQEQDIRQNLLYLFCNQGTPVATFGLALNPNIPDGFDADKLLSDIANGTGASYSNVTGPEDLAKEVISLVSGWLHLAFTSVQSSGDTFPFSIDTFVEKISVISFRSDGKYIFFLDGPNGQIMTNYIQKSSPDPHYELDTLNVSGGITHGTYIGHVNGDPDTQVYVLAKPSLGVELVAPTEKKYFTGNTIKIQAQFISKGIGTKEIITPSENDNAQITAAVTLLVNGHPFGSIKHVELTQQETPDKKLQSPFSGVIPAYDRSGQIVIELQGTFQGTNVQSNTTIQLLTSFSSSMKDASIKNVVVVVAVVVLIVLLLAGLIVLLIVLLLPYLHSRPLRSLKVLLSGVQKFSGKRTSVVPTLSPSSIVEKSAEFGKFLDNIFIARDEQMDSFIDHLERWLEQVRSLPPVEPLHKAPGPDSKLQGLMVFLYGRGGFGKTTLLKRYREKALTRKDQGLHVSECIDWEYSVESNYALFKPAPGEKVDASQYFALLHLQLADALGKRPNEFKKYLEAVKVVKAAERDATRLLNRLQRQDHYAWVSSVTGPTLKLLQLIIPNTQPFLSDEEIANGIKKIVGEGVRVSVEQIRLLRSRLDERLGSRLDDYLKPSQRLGLSLGSDIARFAKRRPLLICFDTYEQIDEADEFLRLVMAAAGSRVGWLIAGRNNLWAGSDQRRRSQGDGYEDVVTPQLGLAIDFSANRVGAFTQNEVKSYFSQVNDHLDPNHSLPNLSDEDASHILDVTKGVPLAIRIIALLYWEKPDISLLVEREDSKKDVVEEMVDRYLRRTKKEDSPEDNEPLYGLALLRRANIATVTAVLDNQYESELSRLHRRYGFIYNGKQPTLHPEVRHFLRLRLLEDRTLSPIVINVNERLMKALQKSLQELENKQPPYASIQARLEDDEWVELYFDLAEQQFWSDPVEGVKFLLPFMIAASIYRRDANAGAYKIGEFFEGSITEPYKTYWQAAKQSLWPRSCLNLPLAAIPGLEILAEQLHQGRLVFLLPMMPGSQSLIPASQKELEGALWWRLAEAYQGKNAVIASRWYTKALNRLKHETKQSEAKLKKILKVEHD